MHARFCTVNERNGLCARPSAAIVKKAESLFDTYKRKVFVCQVDDNGQKVSGDANIGSIMAVMMLAAPYRTKLMVYTDDPALYRAVDELAEFIDEVRM